MRLSVLMSVYGGEAPAHLGMCLESLAKQTLQPDEIVLVEDGPLGEELCRTIDAYRSRLPVVTVRLASRGGLGAALRAGLYRCRGVYVARMDSDDICVAERFERQMAELEAHPGIDVLGCGIAEFRQDPDAPHAMRRLPRGGEALRRFARTRNPMNHMTVVFRKAAVIAAGSYEAFPGFEDYHLWARMMALGFKLGNMDAILVLVRCGNGMQARRGGLRYLMEEIRFQAYLRRMGIQDGAGAMLSILARGPVRLAPGAVRGICYRLFLRQSMPGPRGAAAG